MSTLTKLRVHALHIRIDSYLFAKLFTLETFQET